MGVRIHRSLNDALKRAERPGGRTFFGVVNALAKDDTQTVPLVNLLNRQLADAQGRLRQLSDVAERQAQMRLMDDLSRHVDREMAPVRVCG